MAKFLSLTRKKDEQILDWLNNGLSDENRALDYLYKQYYRSIERHLSSNGAKKEDVKDVFQDTIIVFYENVKAGKFHLAPSISSYLHSIALRLWINKQKKEGRLSLSNNLADLESKSMLGIGAKSGIQESRGQLLSMMNQLKEDCRRILELSIYRHLEMREIAHLMGFKNEQTARNKKSKCLGYLRKIALDAGFIKASGEKLGK